MGVLRVCTFFICQPFWKLCFISMIDPYTNQINYLSQKSNTYRTILYHVDMFKNKKMILKLWISNAEGLQHALRGQQKSASTHKRAPGVKFHHFGLEISGWGIYITPWDRKSRNSGVGSIFSVFCRRLSDKSAAGYR